jgi:hypothetical protein
MLLLLYNNKSICSFRREELQKACFISKSESLPKKWQSGSCLGYSLVPNYASMFRLAGENDAESIFEIQGRFNSSKELQDILILKVLVVPVGDGVSIHLLKV